MEAYLQKAADSFFLMGCVGVYPTGVEHVRKDGMVDGHAYSLLNVTKVSVSNRRRVVRRCVVI